MLRTVNLSLHRTRRRLVTERYDQNPDLAARKTGLVRRGLSILTADGHARIGKWVTGAVRHCDCVIKTESACIINNNVYVHSVQYTYSTRSYFAKKKRATY